MGITYKEYAWLVTPDMVNDIYGGGVLGCPKDHEISNDIIHKCGRRNMTKCNDCWNQEIPYPVIAEAVRKTEIYPTFKAMLGEEFKVCEVDMNTHAKMGIRIIVNGFKFWTNHRDFRYYIDKEEKKVKKEFTKADLRDGMMCERADGKKMLWLNGAMRGSDRWCSGIQNDLTVDMESGLDIVKVGYPDFDKYATISRALDGDFKEVIWERKQEKEISSDEAFAVLKEHFGCDVKIKE